LRLVHVTQQELGERISACIAGTTRRLRLECKLAARELVAGLVKILAVVFEPEPERMLALNPGQGIHKLQSVVTNLVWRMELSPILLKPDPLKETFGIPHCTGGPAGRFGIPSPVVESVVKAERVPMVLYNRE